MTEKKRALIVDDEPDIRELLEITLGRMNIHTETASDLAEAFAMLEREAAFDLCLTDMHLPDGNGLELVKLIGANYPTLPVAVITAFGSMDVAIDALKSGAFDFVQKPLDLEQLRSLIETALKAGNQPTEISDSLTGSSSAMQLLRSQINRLARSQAPIYISGESGSGKEVVARLIHKGGPRAENLFVPVNCGAIPSELMESEFFGHVKGSFTGATSDKLGLFQTANGGTLFLDEVADLPLPMQVKLLRAIQEKAVRPIGGAEEISIDVRVLSATHKNLGEQVDTGTFRQDLYYRLNVIELPVPSLRERSDDIPMFIEQILNKLANEYGQRAPSISEEASEELISYDFPGNVRELENILERAFTLCDGSVIVPADLNLSRGKFGPAPAKTQSIEPDPVAKVEPDTNEKIGTEYSLEPGESLEDHLDNIEKQIITSALEKSRWNKTAAAKSLGITFRALRYRLKKLHLE
ncbi:MAG: sigma-54 dependent transcriptional regulator [Pseudomonadales bacterium]|nr:sigma-54 dependent transcriptional regulator [Pseudomonadales bacterium]